MERSGIDRATGKKRIPAAQYVRMSTDHQVFSTENQADVIAAYAERRGYEIVRTYEDSGRSGLNIDDRAELQRLLSDVRSGNVNYRAILVYDVSRWGRFQDADEAGAYEYECRRVGIEVHYCAEEFENDGSLPSAIMKIFKRVSAASYSKDLSAKVFIGQCRLIRLGFRQGGSAGFGLRRMLLREDRSQKGELARGERKSLQTDRVILVPGPEEEVETVRRMYRLYLGGMSEARIARTLNEEGVATDFGRSWNAATVRQVLRNEKYAGSNVYNHTSFKLKKDRIKNRPEDWIRFDGAFEALIEPDVFVAVQRISEDRLRRLSDEELLNILRDLLKKHGRLSGFIINEAAGFKSSLLSSRFGSLSRAYELVGYSSSRDCRYLEVNRKLRSLHPKIITTVRECVENVGGVIETVGNDSLYMINNEFTVSIVIARCQTTQAGSLRWVIRLDGSLKPDITVAVRMCEDNEKIKDYYITPYIDIHEERVRLKEENGIFLDAYRCDDLSILERMATPVTIRRVA